MNVNVYFDLIEEWMDNGWATLGQIVIVGENCGLIVIGFGEEVGENIYVCI